MPAVVQTSVVGLVLENAKATLARVPAFQGWVGAATIAEAAGHISKNQEDFEKLPRPYALIYENGPLRREWSGQGTSGEFHPWPEGTIFVRFVDETEPIHEGNINTAIAAFKERVALVLDGFLDISGVDSNLVVSGYAFTPEGIGLSQKKDGEPFDGFSMETTLQLPGPG